MKYVLTVYLPGLFLGAYCLFLAITQDYWPLVLLGWVLVSGFGVATGFHRVFSHKTHKLKPWLDNILLFLGTLGGQGSSISWVAVHRGYHHRFPDTPKDLHSPKNGFWNSIVGWYWSIKPDTINHKYAAELLRRPNHVWFHKYYFRFLFGWVASLGVLTLVTGLPFIQVYLAVLAISLFQDNAVNSMCHMPSLGYRNFRLKDSSTNFFPLGYLGWGQGWHENHHAFPDKFLFGAYWWEVDPCVIFVPLLKLGSTEIRASAFRPMVRNT